MTEPPFEQPQQGGKAQFPSPRALSLEAGAIRRALLGWFRRRAHPLPWRKTKDPYAIWLSEVMLQQTQVATVIPYYRRFLRAFPSVAQLAQAPLERVLELWSGLGYYRRARLLHRAAEILGRKFSGHFPAFYSEAKSLPGVGDYTARAVLSIAYNLPYSVLDGNVARVVARLRTLRGSLHQPAFRRAVEQELDRLLSRRRPGNFNQALMELGQTVCSPRAPRCNVCPLRPWCQAYRQGNPQRFPARRPRRRKEFRHLATIVVRRNDKVALVRGLDEGLLSDLWNFPAAFGRSRADALSHLQEKMAAMAPGTLRYGPRLAELHHGVTFRSIRVHVYPGEFVGNASQNSLRWFPLSRLPHAAVSALARKIAAKL